MRDTFIGSILKNEIRTSRVCLPVSPMNVWSRPRRGRETQPATEQQILIFGTELDEQRLQLGHLLRFTQQTDTSRATEAYRSTNWLVGRTH